MRTTHTIPIMLPSARQTWLSLRQNVAMTLRTLREPALSTWREAVRRLPLVAVLVVLPIVIWLLLRTEPIGALAIPMDSITFLAALPWVRRLLLRRLRSR